MLQISQQVKTPQVARKKLDQDTRKPIQHHQDFPERIKICTENILCNFVRLRKAQPQSIINKTNMTPYTVTKVTTIL